MGTSNYTYILCCSDGTYYTGWTNQLEERVKNHNLKKGAKYTKARVPAELVCYQSFRSKKEAMQMEAKIKMLNRKQKERLISDRSRNELLWSREQQEAKKKQLEENRRIKAVTKLTDNSFLNLYQIDARDQKDQPFHYYFASRNNEEKLKLRTHALTPEGIVIYAVKKGQEDKLVMVRQYRYPMDDYIYELPAGLIDPGETVTQAAIREMKEETGYQMEVYTDGEDSLRRPFYMAQGLTDETSSTVFGLVGRRTARKLEDSEDMEVFLISRKKALQLLKKERVSLRAAFLLTLFLMTPEGEPFSFLKM